MDAKWIKMEAIAEIGSEKVLMNKNTLSIWYFPNPKNILCGIPRSIGSSQYILFSLFSTVYIIELSEKKKKIMFPVFCEVFLKIFISSDRNLLVKMSVVDGKMKTMLTSFPSWQDNDGRKGLEILNHLIGFGNIFNPLVSFVPTACSWSP